VEVEDKMASGEIKVFITVITFLGSFALLVSMIPGQFAVQSKTYRQVSVPEYFEAIDIQCFAETKNLTVPAYDEFGLDCSVGGWELKIYPYYSDLANIHELQLKHVDRWWIFVVGEHHLTWRRKTDGINLGIQLDKDELLNAYDADKGLAEFTVSCEHLTAYVAFAYNTTKYENIVEAWANSELWMLIAIGFDQVNTSTNAWNVIGKLLFFQSPDVHPAINALIAIPIWAAVAITIYILILKAIPFVGG